MGTIKILGFDEDGNAQRLKIRIARFLDYDPVTDSDKSNIRSTLGITSQGGLGDLLAANNLDDVASLDTTKANLEIPDVGTAPDETPLNQHLGSLAYADADSVSVGTLEANGKTTLTNDSDNALVVETTNKNPMYVNVVGTAQNYLFDVRDDGTSKFRVDGSGRVGIGNSSMSTYNSNANNLVVGSGSGSEGLTISSGTTGEGGIYFADGTTGNQQYRGYLGYGHTNDELFFGTDGVTKWKLNSTGNLVPQSSGLGIDFGSTNTRTGVTVAGSVLSDYEEGSWTPTIGSINAGPTPGASAVYSGKYVRVGQLVHCLLDMDFDDGSTSVAVDDRFTIGSLPLAVNPSVATYTGAGSCFIYLSTGAGNNALGTVGVTTSGDSAVCYITHIDGTVNWGNSLRAIFTYHTD